ncbi:MAG: hypothetical protein MSH65_02430 [Spirochaetia bacterium]|nr:hypothetical protein [Spirochaetia bacterium]MDY5818840.1 hypothetical protein [Treponema sp.]
MDELCEKLASLGIPALVFLGAMSATGLSGAAAVTAALAALGPGGMIGGIITLLMLGGVLSVISKYGYSSVMISVSKKIMSKENLTKSEMYEKIDSMWLTKSLKARIKAEIDKA